MAFVPWDKFAMTVKHSNQSAAFQRSRGQNRGNPPLRDTRMTQGDRFADTLRIIAGVVEEKGITFMLLPKLPVRGKEISGLESLTTRNPIRFRSDIVADRSVPAVGGDFDRPPQP